MDLKNKRMIGTAHIILLLAMLVLYTRIGGLGMIYVAGTIELFYIIVTLFLGGVPDAVEYMTRIRRKRQQFKEVAKVQKAAVLYSILGVLVSEVAIVFVNKFLVVPGGLKYINQMLYLLMMTVPLLALLQIIRGLMQAELDRRLIGLSELIFVGFMIVGTVCAVLWMGDYGAKAARLMQSVMLEHFYVILGVVPGIITGALAAIGFLVIVGFLYRDQLHIFERKEGASQESFLMLLWQLFTAQFAEVIMPCMRRLPILILLWLSLGKISAENYLFGNFYGAILPVLYLVWMVYDLGLFNYKKRLFLLYRKKQSEQYYRDLKAVLCYVLIHSVTIAGFLLALHKSYLAIWGQQTYVAFMELAAYSMFIGLLGLPCIVLIDILKYRNMQAQAIFSVFIGTVLSIACAVIGHQYWGAGTLLYILCLCVEMLGTIVFAAVSLSVSVGINYISVLVHVSAGLIGTVVISVVLYGVQQLVFTALGGIATLAVCLIIGMILQFIMILALKIFHKDELKELPLSFLTKYLAKIF